MHMCRAARMSTKGCIASILMVASLVAGGSSHAGTVEDTIRAALSSNPDVGVVKADRDAIDQELRQARAGYLPSIDLRAAAGPEFSNSPATRNRRSRPSGGGASTTLLRTESQLTLSQMLFDGFATRSEVDRQLARVDSAAYRVDEAAEFTSVDATEVHLNVLRNQVLVELAQENLATLQGILSQVAQLERQGAGSIADVRQAEARVAAARAVLATTVGNLRDAEALYLAVVGIAPDSLTDSVPPAYALPESPEAAAAEATVASPAVLIAVADVDAAQAELRGSRSDYFPRLDLEMGAGANDNLDGIRGSDVDAQALLVLRYNLFRGGGDVAREREAFARLREARQVVLQVRRDAEEEARIAFNALVTARARVDALRAETAASLATRDIYAQQFDLGQRSLLDLLDSENELYLSSSELATADYTERFAVYRVLGAIGDLLATLDIDPPKEGIDIYRAPPGSIREPSPGAGAALGRP